MKTTIHRIPLPCTEETPYTLTAPKGEVYYVTAVLSNCTTVGGSSLVYEAYTLDSNNTPNHQCLVKECYPAVLGDKTDYIDTDKRLTDGTFYIKENVGKDLQEAFTSQLHRARKEYQQLKEEIAVDPNARGKQDAAFLTAYDQFEANGTIYTILQTTGGEMLDHRIEGKSERPLSLTLATQIVLRLVEAEKRLLDKGYLHMDISPDNIFLSNQTIDSSPCCYLIDYNSSIKADSLDQLSIEDITFKETYAAPEIKEIRNKLRQTIGYQLTAEDKAGISSKSDLYSILLIYKEMILEQGEIRLNSEKYKKQGVNPEAITAINHLLSSHKGGLDKDSDRRFTHRRLKEVVKDYNNNHLEGKDHQETTVCFLETLLHYILEQLQEKKAYLTDILPAVDEYFVGREDDIKVIRKKFKTQSTVILHGTGGIGKSELAKAYAFSFKERMDNAISDSEEIVYDHIQFVTYNGSLKSSIAQTTFTNYSPWPEEKLEASQSILINETADSQEAQSGDNLFDFFNTPSSINSLNLSGNDKNSLDAQCEHKLLTLEQAGSNSLLVIDNYNEDLIIRENDDPIQKKQKEEDQELLKRLRNANIHLLITTRNRLDIQTETISESPDVYDIPIMTDENLKSAFLKIHPEGKNQEETIDTILDLTDRHTLTVILIAKLARKIQKKKKNLTDLTAVLKGSGLNNSISAKVTHNMSEQKVISHLIALFNFDDISDEEKYILKNLCVVPPEGFECNTFLELIGKEGDEWSEPEEIESLNNGGWIRLTEDSTGERKISLHPVFSEVMTSVLEPDYSEESCGKLIQKLTDETTYKRIKQNWKAHRAEAESYKLMTRRLVIREGEKNFPLLNRLAFILYEMGCYQLNLKCRKQVLAIQEEIIPENKLDLAATYDRIGNTYGELGDYLKELEYHKKAVEIKKEVLPVDHPSFAMSYYNIGTTYSKLGNYSKALEYQQKAVEIWEEALPAKHPNFATSYDNIGYIYGELGDYPKALEYQQKAVEILEEALLANHPNLATSYNNIGLIYYEVGDYPKALEYQQKAVEIWEEVLPANHPDLTTSYSNIGTTYGELGDYSKALEYQQKAVEIREKALPSNHPDLATSYNNIGSTYYELGDYSKALEYQQKAIEILEEVLPANHPDLATSYNNIGLIYYEVGDYPKALEYQQNAVEILEEVLPANHLNLATSYNNIGIIYGNLGKYQKEFEYKEKARKIRERFDDE